MNRRSSGPVQLIHFVTSACNAKCSHCFYRENLNRDDDLDLEQIIRITKTLPALRLLIIMGGEPFMRKDLSAILRAYHKNTGIREVTIPTNGFLTEKIIADCNEMLHSCSGLRLNIAVSLDGPPDFHNRIRGVDSGYEKAVKTLLNLKELQSNNPMLKTSVISTLMPENQEVMPNFMMMVKRDLNPDYHSVNVFRKFPKKPGFSGMQNDILEEILKFERTGTKKKGLRSKPRGFLHRLRLDHLWETVIEQDYKISCRSVDLSVVLSENGTVYPCDLINKPLGRLQEYNFDFRELWKSEKRKEARDLILRDRCFCTLECYYRLAVLYSPFYTLKKLFNIRKRI